MPKSLNTACSIFKLRSLEEHEDKVFLRVLGIRRGENKDLLVCLVFPPRIPRRTSISAQSQCLIDEILVDIMVHIVGNGVITVQNVAELALH